MCKKNIFSRLSWDERIKATIDNPTRDDIEILKGKIASDLKYANSYIENAIGYFPTPIGIVKNFIVNKKNYTVPLATEESSVIAALIKTNQLVQKNGQIISIKKNNIKIGQLHIPEISNLKNLKSYIAKNQKSIIDIINSGPAKGLYKRKGGVKNISLNTLKTSDHKHIGIIHINVDTVDAMGANVINQICEFTKRILQKEINEIFNLAVLSNLNDQDIVECNIVLNGFNEELGNKIQEASVLAQLDPYRASTHNKGIMNGIDGVLMATGNDCRAAEAGIHAYAAMNKYTAISEWKYTNNNLYGVLKAPINLGIVGGITNSHPTAKLCLKMLDVKSAKELAQVTAAIGLVQNLGAMIALCTKGIVNGHMTLYIKNLISHVEENKKKKLYALLKKQLDTYHYITHSDVERYLNIIENET